MDQDQHNRSSTRNTMKKRAELVFIPTPMMGHIAAAVELSKLMIDRHDRLYVTCLLLKLPMDDVGSNFIDSLVSTTPSERIRFLHLPTVDPGPQSNFSTVGFWLTRAIELQKPHVRDIVADITTPSDAGQLVGFVVDMFCTPMIDVANEFGVPAYIFLTSNATFLTLMMHLQILHDDHNQDIAELNRAGTELVVPSFVNPVPAAVFPFVLVDKKSWTARFLHYARAYRKAKGIIVNTFHELESPAIDYLRRVFGTTPSIYPLGPILTKAQTGSDPRPDLTEWLDDQPPSSVVFLCFGSRGGFKEEQVREIARGVELSGFRFLWCLRQPPEKAVEFPTDYVVEEVLPEGFLDRTAGRGKVVSGWVRQEAVLSHAAVGGFVSHCGWNSILESLWHGVPIATWPIYAEQQMNAFQMVRELGLAAEISLDYHQNTGCEGAGAVVTAAKIEMGIRRVMESQGLRAKAREMAEKCRMAVGEGGSSYSSLGSLIADDILVHH